MLIHDVYYKIRAKLSELSVDVVQNLLGVNFGLDFLWCENLLNDAILVYKVSGAQGADGAAAAGYLLAPAAQLLEQGGFGVGNEGEFQSLRVGKLLLQSLSVLAYADDGISGSLQLGLVCLKRAGFGSAAAGVGFGIAVKYNLATLVVAGLNLVSVLVLAQDFGYSVSDLHDSFRV